MERLTERNNEGKAITKTLDFHPLIERLAYYEELDTPRKPIYGNYNEDDDGENLIPYEAVCPNCGWEFDFGTWNDEENHHCYCGQRMDWR